MIYYAGWKKIIILIITITGLLFALPNFVSKDMLNKMPNFLPKKTVSLGLDLQGGSYLLLNVEMKSVYNEQFLALKDSVRQILRKASPTIFYKNLNIVTDKATKNQSLVVDIIKPADFERAHNLLKSLFKRMDVINKDGSYQVKFSEKQRNNLLKKTVAQSIEIVRRRVDSTGTKEPVIQKQGKSRIILQLPGIENPQQIKRLLGKTAKLTFHLVDKSAIGSETVSPDTMLLPFKNGYGKLPVKRKVEVSGAHLIKAGVNFNQGRPVVTFEFDSIGARHFLKVTSQNINKQLAVVLDGKVISAPNINSAIGGNGIIEGTFTTNEANELALLLRAGALPAPLTIVEERSVGPGLGADSIYAGKIASIIGCVLVVIFMIITYRMFGIFANTALIVNMLLILGLLSMLQATLTMPGIAGLVLTIGMAVDANVLIFERIREEISSGRKVRIAVEEGYKQAVSTITDANITTLIATLLLYSFGTGAVKGFAVTLSIGVITSMFCALMFSKVIIYSWVNKKQMKTLDL